jgi:hypothetical protein
VQVVGGGTSDAGRGECLVYGYPVVVPEEVVDYGHQAVGDV